MCTQRTTNPCGCKDEQAGSNGTLQRVMFECSSGSCLSGILFPKSGWTDYCTNIGEYSVVREVVMTMITGKL